jgi:3-hydroxyacyl-CoA dehydrogenase/enoyl-CoA hydratase/3-hydroxybutyryl-CoA epimerase
MKTFEHLRIDRDRRGAVTVTFDAAHRSLNVFDEPMLRELDQVVKDLEQDETAKIVLFRSSKTSGFMAGADVHRIRGLESQDQAETVTKLGQELFGRVATLPVPTVAVIHGACLGGGLELALACTYRLALYDVATRMGLPETQLGLIPSWGGTQRLPRLVGLATAVRMILTGSRLSTEKARRIGLIDAKLSPDRCEADIASFVDARLEGRRMPRQSNRWRRWFQNRVPPVRALVLWIARRQIAQKTDHYPALPAALRAIGSGLSRGLPAGLAQEREELGRVLFHPFCHNLLNLFVQRERARKRETWVAPDAESDPTIETIAVVGAGTMGAGIAQLAATKGYAVILKDVDEHALERGMRQIEKLTRQAVDKGVLTDTDAEASLARITGTSEDGPLPEADLVVEAIVERLDVKQQMFRELDEVLPPKSLFVSNTSALPIGEIAAVTGRADRAAGLHFFNPVHKMPLVEVVRSARTSDATIAVLVDVVRKLGKTPIVVAEGPGFLVNRILFPYLDEAVRLVCEGIPVARIDGEAKRFGMPMGPLELLDTVGLDVAADVSETLAPLVEEESPTPDLLKTMAAAGDRGQKAGRGFYVYRNGRRAGSAAANMRRRDGGGLPVPCELAGETITGVQRRLVFAMINAAADCLDQGIVSEPWMVDLGMVLGTGFAPFRGGPLKLVDSWGRDRVVSRLDALSEVCGPRFRPSKFFGRTRQRRAVSLHV